jgi:cytochrome P450
MGFRYDPTDATFRADPYAVYRTMRDEHPVCQDPDTGIFALTRWDDVIGAVHDPATFSNDPRRLDPAMARRLAEAAGAAAEAMSEDDLEFGFFYMDPPRHQQFRTLVSSAFTARRVREMGPAVRRIARELIDGLADARECDIVREFAAPLPSNVISEMIGVPPSQRADFREWAEHMIGNDPDADAHDLVAARENLFHCFSELLAARRAAPADDLMTALLHAEVDGERLSEPEVLSVCFQLIVAGNDTTGNLIANGIWLLAQHPDQRAALVADPGRIPDAVEEILRYEAPVQASPPRAVTHHTELHGTALPQGAAVVLVWGAANHDDRQFDDAERFDVARDIEVHLGFGHGIHFCLGSHLARLEGTVAFEELLRVMPDYELQVDAPTWLVSPYFRAQASLPVALARTRSTAG